VASHFFYEERALSMNRHFAGKQLHTFHIVTESPWPLFGACAALSLTIGAVQKLHDFSYLFFDTSPYIIIDFSLLHFGFFSVCTFAWLWWRDVIREATFLGYHTKKVVWGLRFGMVLFIVSEVMFFFSFFWAFFSC